MKRISIILIVFMMMCGFGLADSNQTAHENNNNPKMLSLIPKHVGLNTYLNSDDFELYGWDVIDAGLELDVPFCPGAIYAYGANDILRIDTTLDKIPGVDFFDAIAIMPASWRVTKDPFRDFMESKTVEKILKDAEKNKTPIITICAGVRVLAHYDMIKGKKVIAKKNEKLKKEYKAAGAILIEDDHPAVVDGNIITGSRDLYYHYQNTDVLTEIVESRLKENGTPGDDKFKSSEFKNENIDWGYAVGGKSSEGIRAAVESTDGNIVLAGYTFSRGAGNSDILFMIIDKKGKLLNVKTIGGKGFEYANDIKSVADGYIICGYTNSQGNGSRDVYVVKTDFSGDVTWEKTFGGDKADIAYSVDVNSSGEIFILGSTWSASAGEEDIYVVKLSAEGALIWEKKFGAERSEIGTDLLIEDDGSILICGIDGTNEPQANNEVLLLKLDSSGKELWRNKFGTKAVRSLNVHGFDWAKKVFKTKEGYTVIGDSDWIALMNIYFVNTDSKGKPERSQVIGEGKYHDYAASAVKLGDDSFVIAGTTKTRENDNAVYVVKTDSRGEVIWKKRINGNRSDRASAVLKLKDGSLIVAGQTNSLGAGAFDAFIMKIDVE